MKYYLKKSGLEGKELEKFKKWLEIYDQAQENDVFFETLLADIQTENTFSDPAILEHLEKSSKDVSVEPGQIRILKGEAVSYPIDTTCILVLTQWSGDRWLIAPFSPYTAPATEGELETGIDFFMYRVVEAWNALVIPDSLLRSQSEFLRDAGENVRMDACTVFFRLLEGKEIPEELRGRVGPSIRFDLDPRIQHLLSEKYQLRPLRRKAQEEERKDDLSGWSFHPLWSEDEKSAAFVGGALIAALVAGEEKKPIRAICGIEQHEELLSIICSLNGDAMEVDIRILTDGRKGVSTALDGSEIVDADKRVLGTIRDGAFFMRVKNSFDGRIALRTPDGMVCRLKATYLRKGF